ncbi:hypothetical protein [Dyadobacter psychrotolerans]|uniref:Outer membrane protein beta-barrel domain-containing protein n=1 Tax=Dyadobacter psychrotolerans TaxID=2541721 RepID=A0A4R5DXS8_9BACT|nr:hypothetical protein [Dyadobacter psychrotolerans]TDE17484.1 hypothetical protein E0F88_06230 [Dyadobacter psychrotolerans]
MHRCFPLLILFSLRLIAQPHFTGLRGGITLNVLGTAPSTMISAEMPFSYRKGGFWNADAGIGLPSAGRKNNRPPGLEAGTTYNFILNPYHRSLCSPAPSYHSFETYLETGAALSIFEPSSASLPNELYKNTYFSPMGIIGLRFHLVKPRWIYICKARMTPLLDREFAVWGGFSLGLGWR